MEPFPECAADHRRLLKLREYGFTPTSILDIGASSGFWSADCSLIFPEAEYFLVEPQQYRNDVMMPQGVKRHWVRQAVGAQQGTVELLLPDQRDAEYNAHILQLPKTAPSWRKVAQRISVTQTTVDCLLETGTIRPPQLVKLDVQGYELEVLRGATRLWDCTSVFFVETSLYHYWDGSPLLSDVVAVFAQHGFQFYDFSTEHRVCELLSQLDIIFVHERHKMRRVMDGVSKPLWT